MRSFGEEMCCEYRVHEIMIEGKRDEFVLSAVLEGWGTKGGTTDHGSTTLRLLLALKTYSSSSPSL